MKKKLPVISAYALLAFAVGLVIFSGCDNRAQKAAAYNDQIVRVQSDLVTHLNLLDSTLNAVAIDEATAALDRFHENLLKSREALATLSAFEGDSTFLVSALTLIAEYENAASAHYPLLIDLLELPDTSFTPEVQKRAFAVEEALITHIREAHLQYERAQRSFGERYKLVFKSAN